MKHLLWFIMPMSVVIAIYCIALNKDLTISQWLYNINNVEFETLDLSKLNNIVNNMNIFEKLSINSFSTPIKSIKSVFYMVQGLFNLSRSMFNWSIYLIKFVLHNVLASLNYLKLNLGVN